MITGPFSFLKRKEPPVATYDATEAHNHIKPEMLAEFKKALADAEAEGKEVYSVVVGNDVPLLYSIRDKS